MIIGGTPAPKREIIEIILRTTPTETIREILKIQAETDIKPRLEDFPKHQLIKVVESTAEGKAALEDIKASYPLSTKPTLYLISVTKWPERDLLFENTEDLARQGFTGRIPFGSDHLIRSVYMITACREFQVHLPFFEVPLVYEKRIEYVESDPNSEDYGEPDVVYSLEKGIVWYSTQFKHALLLCGDFSAVKPILYYGTQKLGLKWQLPFLSEEMLHRLAEGATPRSASFSRVEDIFESEFDAQTMTIFDQELGESRSYHKLTHDESRQQTSGFYSSHPDLIFGGLGISRQYGRVWTPTKLRKDTLLALSINLIQKTETELNREAEINLDGFVSYYRNIPILIHKKRIGTVQRSIFERIIKAIILARKSSNNEYMVDGDLIHDLVLQSKTLDFIVGLEANCENCGIYLFRCPICKSPFQPVVTEEKQVNFQCIHHPEQSIQDNQQCRCECGGTVEFTFSTDIRIFPGISLLSAIHEFLSALENQQFDGSFFIYGETLRLIPRNRDSVKQYSLSDFRYWRIRAHLNQRNLTNATKKKYIEALPKIKEKCSRNNYHPERETCIRCMSEEILPKRILTGKDICLPRIFGFAIDREFDGIHHGHEIADIRYSDIDEETGDQLNLGIHLKSRELPRKRGLGRSVPSIKGLYTQYCYSVYLSARHEANLNVIGISIPNVINTEVIENFRYLSSMLGFPLIILNEDDWIRIIDAAIEKAEVGR